jgi:alkanesulfonate monooxygenase SsuD/methylene tetrahydromethanopterin reductase-like flavin-dependent oxidoreductase (luciferase family)
VPALATTFREAAERAGRDPAGLTVVVRANVPLTREPMGDKRPFLGGSPRQIAEDVARLEPAGVDQVLFSSIAARDLETEVGLLGDPGGRGRHRLSRLRRSRAAGRGSRGR